MNFLLAIHLSYLIVNVRCSNEVPVLAWGSGSDLFNFHVHAHRKLGTDEFSENFLGKLVSDEPSAIVAFVEESLSPEDLVSRDKDNEGAYPLLQETIESEKSVKYLPYVSNPLEAFDALDYETHELTSTPLLLNVPNPVKALFVVKLDDMQDHEGRLRMLQRHDRVIHDVCAEMQKKYRKTLCVLTAKRASWIEPENASHLDRKLLQTSDPVVANASNDDLIVYYHENAGMIFSKNLPTLLVKSTNVTYNLSLPSNPAITKGNNALVVYLTSSGNRFRLSFNFILPNMTYTWQLNSVGISLSSNKSSQVSQLRALGKISASIGNSFHTPRTVTFDSETYTLKFYGMQAQYFATTSKPVFGFAEDQIYFFTAPILTGLFVCNILFTIIVIGSNLIYNVKTMDQFDDPKGKSITINASE